MVKIFNAHFMNKSYKRPNKKYSELKRQYKKAVIAYNWLLKWLGYPVPFNSYRLLLSLLVLS